MARCCSPNTAHTPSCDTEAPSGLAPESTQRTSPPGAHLPLSSPLHRLCPSFAHRLFLLPAGIFAPLLPPPGMSLPSCFLVNSHLILGSCLLQEASPDPFPPSRLHPVHSPELSCVTAAVSRQDCLLFWVEAPPAGRGAGLIPRPGPSLRPAAQGYAVCSLNEREARR